MTTTIRRVAAPLAVAALACAAPAAAQAATLTPDKSCYGTGDVSVLTGAGFTPGGQVNFTRNGVPLTTPLFARADGMTFGAATVPTTTVAKAVDTYVATDVTNPALTATAQVRRTAAKVKVFPTRAKPASLRRVKAAGFTIGTSLYRHTVRGKSVSNHRVGKLKGACRTGSFRQRLFRSGAPSGTYRVQFDARRKYSKTLVQAVRFRVRVYRTIVRRSSASAAAATTATREEWTRIRP